MADSDTVPRVRDRGTSQERSPEPWWWAGVKWLLTGFVFPSAVCGFLIWRDYSVGQLQIQVTTKLIVVLEEVSGTLREVRGELGKIKSHP